jgi:hypothetical protein
MVISEPASEVLFGMGYNCLHTHTHTHTQLLACVGPLCHYRLQPAHYVLPVQLHTALYYYKKAVLSALALFFSTATHIGIQGI